jgi:hypothetical protein
LRSFDRIPFTQDIINQENNSGISTVKADIALTLDLNGLDSFSDGKVSLSSLPNGDPLDNVSHRDNVRYHFSGDRRRNTNSSNLGAIFSWTDRTNSEGKSQSLKKVLSDFEKGGKDSKVSESIAEQGLMTGKSVSDQTWKGDDKEAVKNFVSEECYIHTKVNESLFSN